MGRAVSTGTTLPPLRMSLPSKEASSNKSFERRASEGGPSHGAPALRFAGPALAAPLPRRWRKSVPLCTLRNRRRHPCPRNTRASRHRVSPCPACMGSRSPRCLAAPASRQRWRPRRPRLRRILMLSNWHRHMTRRACQQTVRAPERPASLYRECTGSHCRRYLED